MRGIEQARQAEGKFVAALWRPDKKGHPQYVHLRHAMLPQGFYVLKGERINSKGEVLGTMPSLLIPVSVERAVPDVDYPSSEEAVAAAFRNWQEVYKPLTIESFLSFAVNAITARRRQPRQSA